jgi:hypothetical protein
MAWWNFFSTMPLLGRMKKTVKGGFFYTAMPESPQLSRQDVISQVVGIDSFIEDLAPVR